MMGDPIELTLTVAGTLEGYAPFEATVVVSLEPEPPEPTRPPDGDTTPLCVRIDYQGASYVYDEVLGTDLGDYCEPSGHFVQRCVLCTLPDLVGFRVLFRRDRGVPARDEVVFELGGLWDVEPANMDGYTATIMRGPSTLAVVQAPEHYWHSRWRWQSWPRPIIYQAADFAGGMLPAYSEDLFGSAIPLSNPRTYAGPMDLAGITAYIPSTGERDEIGLFTEAQAEYLCQGTDSAWASVQAWLEAAGSIPLHFRDENTDAPLDWTQYPNATMYSPNGADPYIHNPTSPITLDVSHEGSYAFLSFLLTGDPYALECMQFTVVYNVVMLPPGYRNQFNRGNAVRAVAWTLRALVQAATVTPETVPSWLLPRNLFKTRMDDEREWFMNSFVTSNTGPAYTLSLVNPDASSASTSVWMEDFLTAVLGWIVGMGNEDWRPILEWKCCDVMARTNGTSGWVRAIPSMYDMALRSDANSPQVSNWAACWDLNEQKQPDACAYVDPNALPAGADLTRTSYVMGALALAARAGVPQAQACYDWLLAQLQANTTASKYTRRKWAMAT